MNTKNRKDFFFHQNPDYSNTMLRRFRFVFKYKILLKIISSFFKVWLDIQKYLKGQFPVSLLWITITQVFVTYCELWKSPCIQCVLFGLRWHAVDGCDLHGGLDPWLALIFDLVPICCACHKLQGAFHALMEQLKGRGPL